MGPDFPWGEQRDTYLREGLEWARNWGTTRCHRRGDRPVGVAQQAQRKPGRDRDAHSGAERHLTDRVWKTRPIDDADLRLRNTTYALLVQLGRAPTADEVGHAVVLDVHRVRAGWWRLHEAHALVLRPGGRELRMAAPFSAVPTPFRVHAAGRSWFANCAWDAFGVCAALRVDGRIETGCPDCGEPITVDVHDERPDDESLLFHCLVPAARW